MFEEDGSKKNFSIALTFISLNSNPINPNITAVPVKTPFTKAESILSFALKFLPLIPTPIAIDQNLSDPLEEYVVSGMCVS